MKKGLLLNADISALISRLGHTDEIAVADAGLPIPGATLRIDLALTQGIPAFMSVLEVVTSEMQVEKAIIAQEMKTNNPRLHQELLTLLDQLGQRQGNTIITEYISHQAFKTRTSFCRGVIRSGECAPFANVILCSGVTF